MISFSAINKYLSCPYEYYLHYEEKLRTEKLRSPLWFGKSIDNGLNTLLLTKNVDKAKKAFLDVFTNDPDVEYDENDVDSELLTQEQFEFAPGYYSLRAKGLVMIESYNAEIMPRIKRVISCQETIIVENDKGERIKFLPDAIVEWEDGSVILLDNKTSSIPYKENSAEKSMQLAIYYHFLKEKYNISKIGYIVMRKGLKKNRIKICQECGFDGTGGRHATCPNKRSNGRCSGNWNETIRPECYIQIVINKPNDHFINMVLDNIGDVQYNIENKVYYKNLNSCIRYGDNKCDFYDLCHNNDESGLVRKK